MKFENNPERDAMFEALREKMVGALCSDQEIEATFNLTTLEKLLLSPVVEDIQNAMDILLSSVNADSASRFLLATLGVCNTTLSEIDKYKKEQK